MKLDYAKIKRELSITTVLTEYGMLNGLKKIGNKLYGRCPVHNGDNSRAFNVNLERNLWNCFTHCGGGSVLDLLMAIENIGIIEAAKLGYDILGIEIDKSQNSKTKQKALEFKLNLDIKHKYLKKRNIESDIAKHFGIGYCSKGIMAGRIAIPIHDINGNLIAYCGRAIDESQPKYLFPRGFQKNNIVYNLDKVKYNNNRELVIVEGFFPVFGLHKAGIDAVALMGSSLSYYQKKQLVSTDKKLTLLLDGDESGIKGMIRAISMLNSKKPLKAIYLPENTQPDHFSENSLKEMLS